MTQVQLLTSILEKAGDPLIIVDGTGRIMWHNEPFQHLFTPSRTIPDNVFNMLSSDEAKKIINTTSFSSFEIELKTETGEIIPQTFIVLEVSNPDPESRLFLLCIKSLKLLSQKLAQREEYLASVSHDLKNPLGAIFGYADALLDTASGAGLNPKQKEVLIRVRSTSARAIDLVKNYQQLIELESIGVSKPVVPSDLNAIITSVIESTWRDEQNSPSLQLTLHSGALPVFVERVQLDRVISNLFTNALRYTPSSGKIIIKSFKEGKDTCMYINNTGTAIPPHELSLIFERYHRGSSSKGTTGSGLGLYIVKQILEKVGANIEAVSNPGEGTSFMVRFLE